MASITTKFSVSAKKMFIPPELLILCSVGVLLVNSTQCGRCGPKESRREEMILHKIM